MPYTACDQGPGDPIGGGGLALNADGGPRRMEFTYDSGGLGKAAR